MPAAATKAEKSDLQTSPVDEAFDNLCDDILETLVNQESSELDTLHDVGVKILDAEGDTEHYGTQLTKRVAERLKTYKQKVQFTIRFAKAYDSSDFDELKSAETRSGDPYHWSPTHVRFLLRIKDTAQRDAIAKTCAEEEWTCRRLEKEVSAYEKPKASGRKPSKDLTKNLEWLTEELGSVLTACNGFLAPPNLVDRVKQVGTSMTENQRNLLFNLKKLSHGATEAICRLNAQIQESADMVTRSSVTKKAS